MIVQCLFQKMILNIHISQKKEEKSIVQSYFVFF